MPFLKLRDTKTGREYSADRPEIRVGRMAGVDFLIEGDGAGVVSGTHARFVFREGSWWLEDQQSTNGTFLNERRLGSGEGVGLSVGAVVGFGGGGPRLRVEAAEAGQPSGEAAPPSPPPELVDAETMPMASLDQQFHLTFTDRRTGDEFQVGGQRVRIGRGRECEVRPVQEGDTTVSRVHAEIVLRPDGAVVVRDARSRNGTMVNDEAVTGDMELHPGDIVRLGTEGPHLEITKLLGGRTSGSAPARATPHEPPEPVAAAGPPSKPAPPKAAPRPERPRRSFGGKGRTLFMREFVEETHKKSSARLRRVVWGFAVVLIAGVGGVYWYSEQALRETTALVEEQRIALAAQAAIADSMRNAENEKLERLRTQFSEASSQAAPSQVLDSLRQALEEARRRTEALEASFTRAQDDLGQQLAQAEAQRQAREAELRRLQDEMARANNRNLSQRLVDSLTRAVENARSQLAGIEDRVEAVRGTDLAAVAQTNQGAVGLVSSFIAGRVFDGSGFAITASGYFLTNRHVVVSSSRRADSVFVTMADQRRMVRADIVQIAPGDGPDIAVLKIRNFRGPHVPRIDWTGTMARQGEPAALIGFPAGLAAALDRTQTIRTSMSGGFFSQVTSDEIRFDGFTVGGSSGSPILTADGVVVAIHRAGLAQAAGLAFAVPLRLAIPLLPADARRDAGIQ